MELRSTLFLERVLRRLLSLKGDRVGVEGAWSGNETVARMTIDLNRILLYGRTDGTLGEVPQRRIINVVDAVIAGQGEGPLANDELPLGLIVAGSNQAAVDMVGARLLGYDASRIPTLRLAFDEYRWPITAFRSEEVVEVVADRSEEDEREGATSRKEIRHPIGWTDALAANRS